MHLVFFGKSGVTAGISEFHFGLFSVFWGQAGWTEFFGG
jgi:hypothetical protein